MNIVAKIILAVLVILSALRSAESAQASDPKACADSHSSGQNPSDTLRQSNGVICPPNVDPAMKAPTPPTGDRSVIPAPGSPGGDQSVQPK